MDGCFYRNDIGSHIIPHHNLEITDRHLFNILYILCIQCRYWICTFKQKLIDQNNDITIPIYTIKLLFEKLCNILVLMVLHAHMTHVVFYSVNALFQLGSTELLKLYLIPFQILFFFFNILCNNC